VAEGEKFAKGKSITRAKFLGTDYDPGQQPDRHDLTKLHEIEYAVSGRSIALCIWIGLVWCGVVFQDYAIHLLFAR
jgi:hypothetical protein